MILKEEHPLRLVCLSDIHSNFERYRPENLPDADACIVAGDLTESGLYLPHEVRRARKWLHSLCERYPRVWYIFGNHDILMTEQDITPPGTEQNSLHYLQPQQLVQWSEYGLRIVGANLSTCFDKPEIARMWRDMTPDPEVDAAYFNALPAADIVVSHCPPFEACDKVGPLCHPQTGEPVDLHIGSPGLRRYIERNRPRLVVCGHVHECGGEEAWIGATRVVNAAQRVIVVEIGA